MTISILIVAILILFFLFFNKYIKRRKLISYNGNIIFSSSQMDVISRNLLRCIISKLFTQIQISAGKARLVAI